MSEHDELLSLGDMSQIDEEIISRAGEEDLLDRMQDRKDKQTANKFPWTKEFKENWFSYTLLFLSFLLTEMTAFYLGTSPTLITNPDGSRYIKFNTDFGHLVTTAVYMLVFPAVTEAAFAVFRNLFNKRETGNMAQQVSMLAASLLALVSIVGTGVSGAFVVFSTLGSVGFLEVPPSVQNWLIWIIPILLAIYALAYWVYESNSGEARSRRLGEEQDRKAEIADNLRMREIERAGKRAIRAEAIRTYQRAVSRGLLSHKEASEALSAGMSLSELEIKLRRDLTGEGRIGDTSGLNNPALPSPAPAPIGPGLLPPRIAPKSSYTLDSLLASIGKSPEEARDLIRHYGLWDAMTAYTALHSSGYLPAGITQSDFMPLFCELFGVAPTWGSIAGLSVPPASAAAPGSNGASNKSF